MVADVGSAPNVSFRREVMGLLTLSSSLIRMVRDAGLEPADS